MTVAEKILQHLQSMPESAQIKVLQFVERLESMAGGPEPEDDGDYWFTISLSHAMRGMEPESTPYTLEDIKDSFS
jgi:hypothetical protein